MNQTSLKAASLLCFVLIATYLITMSTSSPSSATAPAAVDSSKTDKAVYIVYMDKPEEEDPESVHIRTLASVLGSEEAAKEALIYSYNTAAIGFAALLTPDQVQQISKQPGVFQVVASRTVQLHPGPGKLDKLFN